MNDIKQKQHGNIMKKPHQTKIVCVSGAIPVCFIGAAHVSFAIFYDTQSGQSNRQIHLINSNIHITPNSNLCSKFVGAYSHVLCSFEREMHCYNFLTTLDIFGQCSVNMYMSISHRRIWFGFVWTCLVKNVYGTYVHLEFYFVNEGLIRASFQKHTFCLS